MKKIYEVVSEFSQMDGKRIRLLKNLKDNEKMYVAVIPIPTKMGVIHIEEPFDNKLISLVEMFENYDSVMQNFFKNLEEMAEKESKGLHLPSNKLIL